MIIEHSLHFDKITRKAISKCDDLVSLKVDKYAILMLHYIVDENYSAEDEKDDP